MKIFFAFLAIYFVVVQAAPPINYESVVNEIIHEAEKIAIDASIALAHQVEEIFIEPLHQLDEAVQSIEDRKIENEPCVVAQEPAVILAVEVMHEEMAACGFVAARTSAQIVIDVNEATQQLIFDGYDLLKTYQRCKKYKNSTLKKTCYARLSVKATLYLKNSRRSIKTIKQSTNERVPAVFKDANACTHFTVDKAIAELDKVNAEIDSCIGTA